MVSQRSYMNMKVSLVDEERCQQKVVPVPFIERG